LHQRSNPFLAVLQLLTWHIPALLAAVLGSEKKPEGVKRMKKKMKFGCRYCAGSEVTPKS